MKMSGLRIATCATTLLWTASAFAAPSYDLSDRGAYWTILGGVVLTDSQRDAREFGPAVDLSSGLFLKDFVAVEMNLFGNFPQTRSTGDRNINYGVGLDFNLGEPEPFHPFALLGGGGLFERVEGATKTNIASPYLEYGVGIYLPNPFFRDALIRADARYNMIFRDVNAPGCLTIPCGKDKLGDVRLNLGMQFGSDFDTPPYVPPPPPPPPPPDSDGDGVIDALDKCPGTPLGTVVDANGCPPPPPPVKLADADGDGVPDTFDQCPDTPAGVMVDEKGCPLPPPPPPPPPPVLDSDGDGVLDNIDQCPNTPHEYKVDEVGCVKLETLVLENVGFAFNSSKLTPVGINALNSVADSLKAHPTLVIEVGGHCDSIGSKEYNLKLSQKRANSVRDYLVSQGVATSRLTAEGYGLSRPVADNKTAEGRARNRRVEFKVLKQ